MPPQVWLLSHTDDKIREGAAFALRFADSPNAVAALASLLDDPNLDIRFSAVNGLCRLTRANRDWSPSIDKFKKNPDAWTAKWKAWWEQEGKGSIPRFKKP